LMGKEVFLDEEKAFSDGGGAGSSDREKDSEGFSVKRRKEIIS